MATVVPSSHEFSNGSLYEPLKNKEEFRNYTNSDRQEKVEKFYKEQHINQTYEFVIAKEKQYENLTGPKCSVWEVLEYMDKFIDDSDPDTEKSQMQHAFQTAEAIRKKFPSEEEYGWFHLVGLIHDIGKILGFHYNEPQWSTVGDTFPVGCKFSDKCVFPQYFQENPDTKHPIYSTELGVYEKGCGLDKVHMSWGHDEYLYRVCKKNSTLPKEALAMIRFHSFYPWHKEGQYDYLLNNEDRDMLKWVKEFNQFDLYSKSDQLYDEKQLKPYYLKLIKRYFVDQVQW